MEFVRQLRGDIRRFESLVECEFALDGGAMFGIVPRPLWERSQPADEQNRITLATRCLLIETPQHRILVDTGMGTKWRGKERDIYRVVHPRGSLREQLAAIGVEPDTITDVLLTHLHFDHAGGLTFVDDDARPRATFPNATHWIQRENWLWAHRPTLRDAGSYRRENFAIFGEPSSPKLRLLDGATTLFDGCVRVLPMRGHTPGMQIVCFSWRGQVVAYLADLIPTSSHIRLPYVMGYDCFPLTTVDEKREVLEHAARYQWVLALEHDPKIGFIRVSSPQSDHFVVDTASALLDEDTSP